MSTDTHEFFLVTLPGLEDLAQQELLAWRPGLECEKIYGGIQVKADLAQGLALNTCLKIPTRILLRLDRFRCRDFPKLYNRLVDFNWGAWLKPDCQLEVFAASKKSRLKIKSRIEETCIEAFKSWQFDEGVKASPKRKAKLFVRVIDDEVTLSLDTSGELLHKRGHRTHIGEAPLRETIAAALLQMIALHDPGTGPVSLLDPMMGSGTFLLEAATRDSLVDARTFGFDNFALDKAIPTLRLHKTRTEFSEFVGFEQDEKTLQAARTNLSSLKVSLELIKDDVFSASSLPTSERRWVVANPPYGERIKVATPLMDYYADLFAAVEKVANPQLACFLLPAKPLKGRLRLPTGWKVLEKRPFLNGGIPVVAFVFGQN